MSSTRFAVFSRSSRSPGRAGLTISFTSTLYLMPVLDLLLDHVPKNWHMEVRLGLQEALVNAAKHGNKLDPQKTISVEFLTHSDSCEWVISDQGDGFSPPQVDQAALEATLCDDGECGRGLFILHQVFDQVQWNPCGTKLRLCKQIRNVSRSPLLT
jgi:serine/threonine-protein kinase RsbW